MIKEVLILGSHCTRSTYYRDMVQEIINEMDLDVEVVKVVEPDKIRSFGIQIGCSNSYCPGCNIVNVDRGGERYTPALVVDGKVLVWSSLPSKGELKSLLENVTGR